MVVIVVVVVVLGIVDMLAWGWLVVGSGEWSITIDVHGFRCGAYSLELWFANLASIAWGRAWKRDAR